MTTLTDLVEKFKYNILEGNRWKFLVDGLLVTLQITFFAVIIGIILGAITAIIRSTYDKSYDEMKSGFGKTMLAGLNLIAKIYLTVVRGTPVVVQLMIMYYIVFTAAGNEWSVFVAILAFGINSGAYVAEIIRSGIMSIDQGQFEAGRSLGLNYSQTMTKIILPQAFKNILPTLANEFIVLLKETSVSGYITIKDLTRGGDIIRSNTFSPYVPLFTVAIMYLVMVMFFTWLVGKLERRLRNDER